MKNVEELYGKYYNAYKSDYDSEDELNEAKKKTFTNSLSQLIKQIKSSNQMKKQKSLLKKLKNKKRVLVKGDLVDILTLNLVHW